MSFQLSLEQVWALPNFTIQQYLDSKGYPSENWIVDRLIVTWNLKADGLIQLKDQIIVGRKDFIKYYQLSDDQLISSTRQTTITGT